MTATAGDPASLRPSPAVLPGPDTDRPPLRGPVVPAPPGPLRSAVSSIGPAFVAAVAYVDPGNFATNFSAGAQFGYRLIWVIVLANLMAMLIQYLSAKLGLATGRNLPQLCREHFRPAVSRGLWVQAELIAMATDLAEFVGAALGLRLLFGVPMPAAAGITAVVAFGVLALDQRGYRPFERAIAGLLGIVFLGLGYDLVVVGADPVAAASGMLPGFAGPGSPALVTGIIGATVMPHVIYLHSALMTRRLGYQGEAARRTVLGYLRLDLGIGLGAAGLINLAMLLTAASLFHGQGASIDSIEAAHAGLAQLASGAAALAFATALLASGLSSSSVGTYAGQIIMQGFISRQIPLYLRRGLTMLPAVAVLMLGLPTTESLVISQVVLSFGIPFALVPLVLLSRRADLLGPFVNRARTTAAAAACAAVITLLNGYLLVSTFA